LGLVLAGPGAGICTGFTGAVDAAGVGIAVAGAALADVVPLGVGVIGFGVVVQAAAAAIEVRVRAVTAVRRRRERMFMTGLLRRLRRTPWFVLALPAFVRRRTAIFFARPRFSHSGPGERTTSERSSPSGVIRRILRAGRPESEISRLRDRSASGASRCLAFGCK
jgi:hypothetical protein